MTALTDSQPVGKSGHWDRTGTSRSGILKAASFLHTLTELHIHNSYNNYRKNPFSSSGVPVIAVERGGIDVKQINSDYYSNGMLAGQLLLNGGCDIFVSLSCGGNEKAAECKRIFGLEQAVKGYPCEKIVWNMQKDLHMGNVVKRLTEMSIGHKPGVFCANTSIAAIVTEECRKSGLKFPTQLELVGCGRTSENSDITSILPDPSLMAQLAIEALNDPLACERVVPVHVVHGTTTSGTEV